MADTDTTCGADVSANALFTSLTAGVITPTTFTFTDYTFDTDNSILYDPVEELDINDLTTGALDGSGSFDKLMASADLHIKREYQDGRITGDRYADVYLGVMTSVLGNATQFALGKDQAKWNAITAQMNARKAAVDAVTARVNLEITKITASKMLYEMQISGAQYALTKIQIATADQQYCLLKAQTGSENFKLKHLLPAELAIQNYQRMKVLPSTVAINQVQSDRVLPAQAAITEFQRKILQPIEADVAKYNRDVTLPATTGIQKFQLEELMPLTKTQEQYKINNDLPLGSALMKEKIESARAQTLDTRTDGVTVVAGVMGKQKELYTQQIDSFKKDAKYKAAKMYLDVWITQKTLDDALLPPEQFQNTAVNEVMEEIRSENGLD